MAIYFKFERFTPPEVANSSIDWSCPFQNNKLEHYAANLAALSPRGLGVGIPTRNTSNDVRDYVSGLGDVPQPEIIRDLISVDQKLKQSHKEFKALQEQGRVVVKPRHVCQVDATLVPGPPIGTVFNGSFNGHFGDSRNPGAPLWLPRNVTPGMVCERDLPNLQSHSDALGVPLGVTVAVPSGRIGISPGQRWYSTANVSHLIVPPKSVAAKAAKLVYNALEKHPWDRGLITTGHAELNSGAWDLLTEIGEAKETISWIFGLLKSGVELVVKTKKAIRQAHRRPGQSSATLAEEMASIWMQFRYAFSPIGYSVNDALDYFFSEFRPYETYRAGSNFNLDVELPEGWSINDLKPRDRVWIKHRYSADYSLHNLGFNPAVTAWELTPLSFVVDWLLNIGDLLAALKAPSNVIDMGCTYSRQFKGDVEVDTPQGRVVLHVGYYRLTPYNPLDRVGLTTDLTMTWKRWLDAISLTWLGTKSMLK